MKKGENEPMRMKKTRKNLRVSEKVLTFAHENETW